MPRRPRAGFGPAGPKGAKKWPTTGPAPDPPAAPPTIRPNTRTRWVIYGVFVGQDGRRKAITEENLTSEEDAQVKFVVHYMAQARTLDAVLIRLDNGKDVNGERHVVRRAGGGRAWWE